MLDLLTNACTFLCIHAEIMELFYDFKSFIRLMDENSVLLSIWQILGTCSYTFYTMHKQQSQMQRNVLIVDRTQGHKDPVFIAFMLTIKHDGPSDCPWSFLKRHLRNADKYLCLHNGIGEQILHLFTTEKQSRWCTKSQWITYCYFYKCPMNSTFIPPIIKIPFWWWERAAIIRKRNSLLGS